MWRVDKLWYRGLFRKSSMLRKLLLSIIFLICTPLILIQIYSIQNSKVEFTEAQHTQTLSYLQSMHSALDEHMRAISLYGVKIAGVEEVKYPLQEDVSEYKLYTAALKIKEYDSVYPLIRYVGVYYPSTDRVLCNGYCYRLQEFAGLYYEQQAQSKAALTDFLTNIDGTAYFSTGEYPGSLEQQLLLARSVAVGGGLRENATVFFAIEDRELQNWCAGFLSQSAGFAVTMGDEVLLHTGTLTTELLSSNAYREFAADLNRYSYDLNDSDETLIYKYKSPDSELAISVAMPQNMIHANVDRYVRQVRMTLILTVLVMIIFTIITVYINYKPIWTLLRKHAPQRESTSGSELDLLDSAFFLRDEQISSQDNLIRTFLISDILTGVQVDKKEVSRYFPKSDQLLFAVSLTDITFTTAQTSTMIEKAEQLYHLELLITTLPQRKETLFIIFSNRKDDFADREERLNQIVLHTTGYECGFVSGCVVNNIRNVEQSYKDALQNYYTLTEPLRIEVSYPAQLVQEFGNSIRRNNLDEALELLEQLKAKLPDYSAPYQKLIGLDVLRTYIHSAPENVSEDLEYILLAESVTLMFAYLHNAVSKRQREAENTGKDINKEMKALLVEYVDQNCLDSALCLTSAADYMNTSIYTVSRLFKEATGMGFKDYITSKRLKHACHLLKTTNMSVNAIAAACGFERIAYFSTIFKNEYGVAPSVYRANNGQAK